MGALPDRNFRGLPTVSALFVFLCLVGLAPRVKAASANSDAWSTSPTEISSQSAIADFDGDTRPDFATVQDVHGSAEDARYRIRFQLSAGSQQTIDLIAQAGGLDIRSRDVNGDGCPDVIVTTLWTNRPVVVLINDGRGNFTPFDPSVSPGAFTTYECSWASRTDEIGEDSALLSRFPSGDCEQDGSIFSSLNETELQISYSSQVATLSSFVSFLGRAPPFYSLPF